MSTGAAKPDGTRRYEQAASNPSARRLVETERLSVLQDLPGEAALHPLPCVTAAESGPDLGFNQKLTILSVDDSTDDFERLSTVVPASTTLTLVHAPGQTAGLEALQQTDFDIVLLDHHLHDGSAFSFLEALTQAGVDLPVVVITGKGDELLASQIIQAGAYDYLPKHCVNRGSITRSINNALEKYRLRRENERALRKIREMATRDELTCLYNRRYFMETLNREVARARRFDSALAVCMIDLDHFKQVNDTFGHRAGDMVLSDFSAILKDSIRDSDLACRYGGEEFTLILPNTAPQIARRICQDICTRTAGHTFTYDETPFNITVSIGITAFIKVAEQTPADLVEVADRALYDAKRDGRNRVVELSDPNVIQRPKLGKILISEGMITIAELDTALREQQLPVGQLLIQAGYLTVRQLEDALAQQKQRSGTLCEILKHQGVATPDTISWVVARRKRKLGQILLDQGLLTDAQLERALARQEQLARQQQQPAFSI